MRIIWTLLLIGLLSSCANIKRTEAPTTTIPWEQRQLALMRFNHWDLNGKIGIITAQNSGSASIRWQEDKNHYTINLSGPLGAGAVTVMGEPGQVSLQASNGQTLSAATPEQLLAQTWGWQLPVSYLKYWVRGLPVPDLTAQKEFDQAGRLSSLSQQGWQISYLDYQTVGLVDLPRRINIHASNINIKLVIHQWVNR